MLAAGQLMSFVATANAARALGFYRDVLGFPLVEDSPFALVFDLGAGRRLRVQKVQALQPSPHTVLGWAVADIGAEAADLAARGVTFHRYPPLEQDEAGVWRTPNGDQVAWFADPDGNILSLTEFARGPQAAEPAAAMDGL
jgi:catechol 2,3-dioxygenase-like lactoylglutathione lyase family enzyme